MEKLKCALIACLVICLIGLVSISIFSKESEKITLEKSRIKRLHQIQVLTLMIK